MIIFENNNLNIKLIKIFNEVIDNINSDLNRKSYVLVSDSLKTIIRSNHKQCSEYLSKLSIIFKKSLMVSHNCCNIINAFITENENVFQKIEHIFKKLKSPNDNELKKFNVATRNTSIAKCTIDKNFYIIKCYDYFYYIFNKETNTCLMVTTSDKRSITMVNILLLTPYLLCGDLYAIHGGLVSDGKNNVLLYGSSLGGKTSFALLFLENKWQIITEDTTYITKQGKLLNYNVRNYFNIRIGTYLEFKDFFKKAGIINNSLLRMEKLSKEKLFKFGKYKQMSIWLEDLCKYKRKTRTNQITHALKIALVENKSGINIRKMRVVDVIKSFMEISYAPTVMLFKNFLNIRKPKKSETKKALIQLLKNIKAYSITSGLDYRKNFNLLLEKTGLL